MNFEIIPHIGIGPIKLGMSCLDVKNALGEKSYSGSNGNIDYYFNNSFQVEFDDDKAEFIGVSHHSDCKVLYKGIK